MSHPPEQHPNAGGLIPEVERGGDPTQLGEHLGNMFHPELEPESRGDRTRLVTTAHQLGLISSREVGYEEDVAAYHETMERLAARRAERAARGSMVAMVLHRLGILRSRGNQAA